MFNSKKKVLEYEKPIVSTYPHTANIYGIMKNNPYLISDLAVEMIGMVYDRELDRLDYSISLEIMRYMNNYPLMYCHGISRTVIGKKWKRFSSFVEDMIDDGYYIQLLLDTYYIRAYGETYQRQHFMHNPMIYGYDKSSKTVIMADSFEKGIYETRIASYDEINNGFLEYFFNDWLDGVRLCKMKEDPFICTGYNARYLIQQIENYVDSKNTTAVTYEEDKRRRDVPDRFAYGISIYDEIENYLQRVIENEASIDIRIFYQLYDHFNLLTFMIGQLIQRKQLKEGNEFYSIYVDFVDRAKNLYMQVLKFNITHSEKTIRGLIDICKALKEEEKAALQKMSENIVIDADVSPDDSTMSNVLELMPGGIYIEYNENWHRRSLFENTYYTDKDGAYAKCQFYGRYISLAVKGKESYGVGHIFIDGRKVAEIDYSSINVEDVVTIDAGQVGYHSLKLAKQDADGKIINISKINVQEEAMNEQNNTAKLIEKRNTKGSRLYRDYGKLGRDIMGAERKLPETMTLCNYRYEKAANIILMHRTADDRGVGRPDEQGNIAAYALSDKEFNLDMVIPGDGMKVTFYFVDYDRLNRDMKVVIKDGDTGDIIATEKVSDFQEGLLVGYEMKGHLKIYFVNEGAPDAVLSAVFWD